ncbi:PP2C family protein-serine/threonine phosphatase [Sanguibacter suaedae]|uniref:Serine/threonine-protein phosphatase n=1 Tax=Sanguibacter suaedae TaxID=2795737 RepID=A0A934I5G6_9MICO|nr:protein phosphatase 2C domain-containing protein [Sanguibacter suaedae]MBI9115954.1 serine/threonine-protein phosphatase [Sanguibacter suaedae]
MHTTWGSATDTGRIRTFNEDALLAYPPIFLVADGMGGHDAGDVASRLVVEEFSLLVGRGFVSLEDVHECFSRAASRLRDRLGGRSGGTTVAGAAIAMHDDAAYWLVFNIGDSRVYRLVDGALDRVTVDHSVVQELVDAGRLDAKDVATHAERHVVTRALATDSVTEPDYWMIPAAPQDRLLICSDGLTDEIDDDKILVALSMITDAQEAAEALVDAAVEAGGRDNVTVVVVDVATIWHGLTTADETHNLETHDLDADDSTPAVVEWDEHMHGVTQPRPRTVTS